MDRVQPRGRIMRLLALGAVLIALTAGYVVMVRQFDVTELPLERHFGATDQVVPAGEVYIEPISIDALNDGDAGSRVSLARHIGKQKRSHRLRPRFDLVGQPRQHGGGNQAGGGRPYRQLDLRGRLERGQRHSLPI